MKRTHTTELGDDTQNELEEKKDATMPLKQARSDIRWMKPASTVPTRNKVMSSHVRFLLQTSEPEQSKIRGGWNKMCLPATKMSNAIGLNTFTGGDPVTLWKELLGYIERTPIEQEAMERIEHGIVNESFARRHYEHFMGPDTKVTLHEKMVDPLHHWILHGCDGHAKGRAVPGTTTGPVRDYMVEIKCPSTRTYTTVPVDYMVQMQTGLAVHGMPWCDFVIYSGRGEAAAKDDKEGFIGVPHRLIVLRVWASSTCWMKILEKATYFMDCLYYKVEPQKELLFQASELPLFQSPAIKVETLLDKTFPKSPLPPIGVAS